jgi:hypothetical protein
MKKKVTENRISVFGIGLHDMKSTMELKGKNAKKGKETNQTPRPTKDQ